MQQSISDKNVYNKGRAEDKEQLHEVPGLPVEMISSSVPGDPHSCLCTSFQKEGTICVLITYAYFLLLL